MCPTHHFAPPPQVTHLCRWTATQRPRRRGQKHQPSPNSPECLSRHPLSLTTPCTAHTAAPRCPTHHFDHLTWDTPKCNNRATPRLRGGGEKIETPQIHSQGLSGNAHPLGKPCCAALSAQMCSTHHFALFSRTHPSTSTRSNFGSDWGLRKSKNLSPSQKVSLGMPIHLASLPRLLKSRVCTNLLG